MRFLQLPQATSLSSSESRPSSSGVVLALSMTMLFVVLVLVPACAIGERRRRRRRRRVQDLLASEESSHRGAASPPLSDDDLRLVWERRYHTVESWIVTKLAHEHDDICEALTFLSRGTGIKPDGFVTAPRTDSLSDDYNKGLEAARADDVEHGSEHGADWECPICFERFVAGELLSWSADPKCDHVFHHGCIKEWLVDRKDCPFCRTVVLPVDAFGTREAVAAHIPDLILGQKRRGAPCFYCLEHQVVRLPSSTQLDSLSLPPTLRRQAEDRCARAPDRTSLIAIRRRTNRSNADDAADPTESGEGSGVAYGGGESIRGDDTNPQHIGPNADSPSDTCYSAVERPVDEASVRQRPPTLQELEYVDCLTVDNSTVYERTQSADPCNAQSDAQV